MTARKGTGRSAQAEPLVRFPDLKRVGLAGARGKAPPLEELLDRVGVVERRHRVQITVVDARAVCGAAHLASAVHHARGAATAGAARARDPKVEVMLYLSGQRQIKHAMARVSVGPRTAAFGIVLQGQAASTERAVGDLLAALSLRRDDKALSPSRAKLRRVLGEAPPAGMDDFEALALEATAMLRLE